MNIYAIDPSGLGVVAFTGAALTAFGFIGSLVHQIAWYVFGLKVMGTFLVLFAWGNWRKAHLAVDDEGASIVNWFGRKSFSAPWSLIDSLTVVSHSAGKSDIFLSSKGREIRLSRDYVQRGELVLDLESRMRTMGAVEHEKHVLGLTTRTFVRSVSPS